MPDSKLWNTFDNTALHSVIIFSLFFFTYLNALHADFISLDDVSILNMLQTSELPLRSLFFGGGGDYFRPMVFLSFILDLKLFGRDPLVFHAVNIGLHLINTFLVYLLAIQTIKPSSLQKSAACVSALLFALHPVNSEAVLWMAARTDLLCCTFFLLALLVGLHQSVGDIRAAVAFFIMFLCSLLSKEASIAMVLILPVYYLMNRSTVTPKRRNALFVALAAATVLYLFMRNGFQHGMDNGISKVVNAGVAKPLYVFVTESYAAFGFYIKKLFLPLPLNFAIVTIDTNFYALVGIITSAVLLIAFWKIESLRLALLIVVFGLVPPLLALHGKLPWTPFAERYVYLPSVGLALAAGICVSYSRFTWLRRLSLVLILVCGIATINRVVLWTDTKAFWYDVLNKSPEFPRSYVGVAIELIKEAKYDEAERLLKKSLDMGYKTDFVWANLAAIALARGDYVEYEKSALCAAQLSKHPASNYRALAQTLIELADRCANKDMLYRRVASYYLTAFTKDPSYIDGLYTAAKWYMYLNENELAQKYFRQFLATPGETMYKPFAKKLLDKLELASGT